MIFQHGLIRALALAIAIFGFVAGGHANEPKKVIEQIGAINLQRGSDAWDEKVKKVLLNAYDLDKSGVIDSELEVKGVACEVLIALDQFVKPYDRRRSGLTWTYGFMPSTARRRFTYVGHQLGFAPSMRGAAFAHMKACGVRTQ